MSKKKNKVRFGLKNCYYAKATFDEDGNVIYDTPSVCPALCPLALIRKVRARTSMRMTSCTTFSTTTQAMLNAYRVLLTRARAGMVICIPEGNANKTPSGFWEDSTRLPKYYDGTYRYLKSLGIEEL